MSAKRGPFRLIAPLYEKLTAYLAKKWTFATPGPLSEPAWATRLTPEDLRALTPLIYGHISPYGTFQLDMKTRLDLELRAAGFPAEGYATPVTTAQRTRGEDQQLALFHAAL